MTFKTSLYIPPKRDHGHKLFADEDGRVSLCDWSATFPEHTDDGPLVVSPGVTVTVTHFRDRIEYLVPVTVTRNDGVGLVRLDEGTMEALSRCKLGLQFEFDTRFSELLRKVEVAKRLRHEASEQRMVAIATGAAD